MHEYFWNTNLLPKRDVKALFPGGELFTETFLGFPKFYYIIGRK